MDGFQITLHPAYAVTYFMHYFVLVAITSSTVHCMCSLIKDKPIIYIINYKVHGPGELSEELMTQEKRKKGWRMNCDVDEAAEGL